MSFEVPVEGGKESTEDPKIKKAIEGLNKLVGPENKIKGAGVEEETLEGKHLKDATVTDGDLANPNNGAYRTLLSAQQILSFDQAAGTYILSNATGQALASGVNILPATTKLPHFFYFDDADYTVAGKTQKLRLRAQAAVNGTKATMKFTVGLYPLSVGGGTDELTLSLGTVVSGSTVEINEPAASAVANGVGSDFAVPADGAYALGVVTSGTLTNNSAVLLSAQLQTHHT